MATSGEIGVNLGFVQAKDIPDSSVNRPTVVEQCSAGERAAVQGSLVGAQQVNGLWRICPATTEARNQLLVTVTVAADGKNVNAERQQPSEMEPEHTSDSLSRGQDRQLKGAGVVAVPARYVFSVLAFLFCFTTYCLRTCLNVALVAMVNSTAVTADDHNISHTDHCSGAEEFHNSTTKYEVGGEFRWDERTQGVVLGAFYYGYILPQVLGGWLADRLPGKRMLGCAVLLSCLLSLAAPSAARAGAAVLVLVRVLQGLVEGVAFPSLHALCSKWVPVEESSKLVAFIYSGCECGVVGGMLLTGFLSRYGFAGGWPSAFYVFGMMGCLWVTLWTMLVYESPAEHPRISDKERMYIENSLQDRDSATVANPWRDILTSAPVWGVCVAHFSYCWGYYSMFTCLPLYMKQIHHFDIVENGLLSALPYLLMWLTQVLGGVVSDVLRRHLSTSFTRKLMYAIGCVAPAGCLVGTGYVHCDHALAVALLTLGVTAKGIAASTVYANHLDLAPKFAGTLFGMSNNFATIPGMAGPALIGYLTYQSQTVGQWRKFFFVTAAIYIASVFSFLWLGKGEVQAWAVPTPACSTAPACATADDKDEAENKI